MPSTVNYHRLTWLIKWEQYVIHRCDSSLWWERSLLFAQNICKGVDVALWHFSREIWRGRNNWRKCEGCFTWGCQASFPSNLAARHELRTQHNNINSLSNYIESSFSQSQILQVNILLMFSTEKLILIDDICFCRSHKSVWIQMFYFPVPWSIVSDVIYMPTSTLNNFYNCMYLTNLQ